MFRICLQRVSKVTREKNPKKPFLEDSMVKGYIRPQLGSVHCTSPRHADERAPLSTLPASLGLPIVGIGLAGVYEAPPYAHSLCASSSGREGPGLGGRVGVRWLR